MNATNTENFMRSTTAPIMSAGVMIANMPWNMMKMYSGMLRGGEAKLAVTESSVTPCSMKREKSPMNGPEPPKARL